MPSREGQRGDQNERVSGLCTRRGAEISRLTEACEVEGYSVLQTEKLRFRLNDLAELTRLEPVYFFPLML